MEFLNGLERALSIASPVQIALWSGSALAVLLGLAAGLLKLISAILDYRRLKEAEKIQRKISFSGSVSSFTSSDIRDGIKNYVVPDCAQTDPSNQNDLRNVADVRESVMSAVERFIDRGDQYRHMLILADSGMGKTTFCMNFYVRMSKKKNSNYACAIIPLGRPSVLENIRKIENQSDTILLLDAFDEDPVAIENGNARISAIMDASSAFRSVIITCRSQFFENDASIPTRTGVSVIRPRRAGERSEYHFYKLYLLPFSTNQIDKYLDVNFQWWKWNGIAHRAKAKSLIAEIPELSVRPMLLALVPDLIKSKEKIYELFDLYKFMVDRWVKRESDWISPEILLAVSKKLAVYMYTSRIRRGNERVTLSELQDIAKYLNVDEEHWKHLTARSLLNRDSDGNFKFSHRSIMEYLYVVSAIEGDAQCFTMVWTDLMRELFVSWGGTKTGLGNLSRAQEMLSLDLEKLGLSPLSSPLPTPRTVSASSFLGGLPEKGLLRTARKIPYEWRSESLRFSRAPGVLSLRDLQYDLIWRLPDLGMFDEVATLGMTYADVVKTEVSNFRLPSLEEFASLVEAEAALEKDLIHKEGFIWLGDQLGRQRYVVASVSSDQIQNEAVRLLGRYEGRARGGASIWVYEVASRPKGFGGRVAAFSAMGILVREGDAADIRRLASMPPELLLQFMDSTGLGAPTKQ